MVEPAIREIASIGLSVRRFKANHFGRKPVSGGIPLKDRRSSGISHLAIDGSAERFVVITFM